MKTKLIYIVDDEEDILDILSMIMRKAGYEFKTFLSPVDLLKSLSKQKPDAILSDFRMPEMNGLELLKSVRSKHQSLPFIIISAHIEKSQMIEAIDLDVSGVVEKPFKDHDLLAKLSKALNRP